MPQVKILKRPKMSEIMKGKRNRLGIKMSESAKRARREKMGSKLQSRKRIAVLDLDTNTAYLSIQHAANVLGVSTFRIMRALKNRKQLTSGKTLIKLEEQCPAGF